jgi:hypothetical protein
MRRCKILTAVGFISKNWHYLLCLANVHPFRRFSNSWVVFTFQKCRTAQKPSTVALLEFQKRILMHLYLHPRASPITFTIQISRSFKYIKPPINTNKICFSITKLFLHHKKVLQHLLEWPIGFLLFGITSTPLIRFSFKQSTCMFLNKYCGFQSCF